MNSCFFFVMWFPEFISTFYDFELEEIVITVFMSRTDFDDFEYLIIILLFNGMGQRSWVQLGRLVSVIYHGFSFSYFEEIKKDDLLRILHRNHFSLSTKLSFYFCRYNLVWIFDILQRITEEWTRLMLIFLLLRLKTTWLFLLYCYLILSFGKNAVFLLCCILWTNSWNLLVCWYR